THKGNKTTLGKSGKAKAVQTLTTQPQSACPDKPMLKKPAEFATEKPRAVKINGVACRKVSPILRWFPKEACSMDRYPFTGLKPKATIKTAPKIKPKSTERI